MPAALPPNHILLDFLRSLEYLLRFEEDHDQRNREGQTPVVVVRGSVLMQHWFGPAARPAGDIDLECFPTQSLDENPRIGYWGEYQSLVDYAKAQCRYSGELFHYSQAGWQPRTEFFPMDFVEGGASLWVYGTPGERYIAGWRYMHEEGSLQIDIAQPEGYGLKDIHLVESTFELPGYEPFRMQCYSQEALAAAKLSWVLRGLSRRSDARGKGWVPIWNGEIKDLFDLHLLLTAGIHSGVYFQRSLLGFCQSDEIHWESLVTLMRFRDEANMDMEFRTWPEFQSQYPRLVRNQTPQSMLREIAQQLEPLLGQFYVAAEQPFLEAIHEAADASDACLIYADYLEERGDARGEFARLLASAPLDEVETAPPDLCRLSKSVPAAWLQRLSGSTTRHRAWMAKLGSPV